MAVGSRSALILVTVSFVLWVSGASAEVLFKISDSNRSPATAVVLRPREKQTVEAECPDEVSFVLFQAHTKYGANVTLSYDEYPRGNNSHSSRNAGLLRPCSDARVFLINEQTSRNLTVLLIAVGYSKVDPTPGGCNMEFPVRVAPYLRLNLYSPTEISIDFQHARAGSLATDKATCQESFSALRYEIYLYYMGHNEDYHKALQLMSDAHKIRKHATRVHATLDSPKTRNIFVAYPQNRAIYGVVVTQIYRSGYSTAAAYVPVATLGCGDYPFLAACRTSTGSVIALAVFTAMALCMALAGHRFLKTQIALAAFVLSLLVFEPLMDPVASVALAASVATLFLGIWFFFGIPVIAVIPSGFLLGLLITAIFFFTPVGNLFIFRSVFAYRTVTICTMLSITALLLPTTQLLSIVASAVVGSFSSLYAVDRVFLHSTFSKIVDVARARFEATTSIHTHNQVPFAVIDVILICIWLVLSLTGIVVQYKDTLETDREFPVAPVKLLKRYLKRRKRGRLICTCASRYDDTSFLMNDNDDELPSPGYSTFHGRNILI
ncbi:transmembrane 7 superfamily member 3-like [Galendromus occidentalis]|uniref:Transmembrane 7 superfamily member 3-like n=1 Tax=Galendromus occidentalis TaxID=34638 RepID=A0AAJ6QNE8_9ACAR|nr:transmembrane 7 superfamily member 3-like [Galendromus occidentalis]